MSVQLARLLEIMKRLRDPETGCEWDRAQTFLTVAPYTIEEAYEVADAIERNAMDELREELGDLLLQVVFHSRMAEEVGSFDFDAVAGTIADKMETRHPHIFGDMGQVAKPSGWESIKAAERQAKGAQSSMDGVAQTLPALMRAEKLQKRAARDGFDWPNAEGPAQKLAEEAEELAGADPDAKLEEAGDLLFAAVNLVRAYGVGAEDALRQANRKFERRYRAMEALAQGDFPSLSLDEQEALWQRVKVLEADKTP